MSTGPLSIALGLLLVSTMPSVSFAQEGTLEKGTITSPALGGETKAFYVYLPPSYTTSEKQYPSYYALHRFGGSESSLINMKFMMDRMIQNGEIGEMIAVFPDGDDSYYPGDHEPYITRDLVQYVDAHYRAIPDRNAEG
jgi:enterochelin esterase-like enzyme